MQVETITYTLNNDFGLAEQRATERGPISVLYSFLLQKGDDVAFIAR